ncbi:MAG: thioesterase family protein [Chloroflexi bacterium]|nr:thioesterase family protein [Chloroflexota bacterium]MBU1749324.1 thioesterase family protein [Chloroflexota bacterium]
MTHGYEYKHIVTPRDVTMHGIAYDLAFLEWACTARERMIIERVGADHVQWPSILVGEVHLRYIHPAIPNDHVTIQVVVTDVEGEKGRARLVFNVTNTDTGQLLATGYQILFFADPETGRRVEIPAEFQALAQA